MNTASVGSEWRKKVSPFKGVHIGWVELKKALQPLPMDQDMLGAFVLMREKHRYFE